jgi:predicted RNase H-like HicB family nuclease
MTNLKYSLVIESTADPNYFGYYSPDLEGFSGSGSSIEECLRNAQIGMVEHLHLLKEGGLPIPRCNPNPTVTIVKSEHALPVA